ncbi:hypothetical protein [Streptococcus sp. zg-JUN1979]|uniref:hypothetical protein n=1 Tax=Streptococcus sp. zg-JUN1979 TaxID=3391450 RepID=UPI0039A6C21B
MMEDFNHLKETLKRVDPETLFDQFVNAKDDKEKALYLELYNLCLQERQREVINRTEFIR